MYQGMGEYLTKKILSFTYKTMRYLYDWWLCIPSSAQCWGNLWSPKKGWLFGSHIEGREKHHELTYERGV